MKRSVLLIVIILSGLLGLKAQEAQEDTIKGNIQVFKDARLDTLLERYQRINREKASIQGFRIQIVSSSNRAAVYKMKAQFYSAFPKIKPYVIYQQPNFKLRVGNYKTRLEAYKELQRILPRFNDAFIIRDELKISEL